MTRSQLVHLAKRYGEKQAASKAILPNLAMEVARAAAERQIAPEDAGDIYDAYRKAVGIPSHNQLSKRAQVSKLRQIIELGAQFRSAVRLLEQTLSVHKNLSSGRPNHAKPAYAAMVDVARASLRLRRALTRTEIAALCRK